MYSVDKGLEKQKYETPLLTRGEQPELDLVGFALERVGDVSEPIETSRGWVVLKLRERQDERTYTLAESHGSIKSALQRVETDRILNELLAQWREDAGVVVHEDNLRKVQVEERAVQPTTQAAAQ